MSFSSLVIGFNAGAGAPRLETWSNQVVALVQATREAVVRRFRLAAMPKATDLVDTNDLSAHALVGAGTLIRGLHVRTRLSLGFTAPALASSFSRRSESLGLLKALAFSPSNI